MRQCTVPCCYYRNYAIRQSLSSRDCGRLSSLHADDKDAQKASKLRVSGIHRTQRARPDPPRLQENIDVCRELIILPWVSLTSPKEYLEVWYPSHRLSAQEHPLEWGWGNMVSDSPCDDSCRSYYSNSSSLVGFKHCLLMDIRLGRRQRCWSRVWLRLGIWV
jgi:hypothetical protein